MFRARTPRILLLNMSSTTSSSVVVVANVPFPMILRSSIPERGPKLTASFFHYNIPYLLIIPPRFAIFWDNRLFDFVSPATIAPSNRLLSPEALS